MSDRRRDPTAIAVLGSVDPKAGKLRVRDVLFGREVSRMSLAIMAIVALLLGFTGGVIGRKTAEVAESFTNPTVTLSNHRAGQSPESMFAKVAAAVANAVVEVVATSGTDVFGRLGGDHRR